MTAVEGRNKPEEK